MEVAESHSSHAPERSAARRTLVRVALAVVAIDATTKALAVHFLSGRSVSVLGGAVHLELYRNYAGPRNTFEGHPVLVSLLAAVSVAGLVAIATRVRNRLPAIAIGLLLGGGIGNLLDRLFRAPGPLHGGVVDWLRPAWSSGNMNLADLAITAAIGVALAEGLRLWLQGRAVRGTA